MTKENRGYEHRSFRGETKKKNSLFRASGLQAWVIRAFAHSRIRSFFLTGCLAKQGFQPLLSGNLLLPIYLVFSPTDSKSRRLLKTVQIDLPITQSKNTGGNYDN